MNILSCDELSVILEFLDIFDTVQLTKSNIVVINWRQMHVYIKWILRLTGKQFSNYDSSIHVNEKDFLKLYLLCPQKYKTTKLIPRNVARNVWHLNTTDVPYLPIVSNLNEIVYRCIIWFGSFKNFDCYSSKVEFSKQKQQNRYVTFIKSCIPEDYNVNASDVMNFKLFHIYRISQKNVYRSYIEKNKIIIRRIAARIAIIKMLELKYPLYVKQLSNILVLSKTYKMMIYDFPSQFYNYSFKTWYKMLVQEFVEGGDIIERQSKNV